jgi:nitrogen-specific signal transduction histidine kinase/CheY-like chemotaxis protein
VFRDTSERKKLEDRVRQSQKLEAIGTLAGGIAHDFNNILSAIMGYSELALTKTEPGSEIYQDLEQVSLAASRARDLVKHILTFSRKSDTEIVPLRIQVIVKEVIKLLRSTFPTTITIHQDVDGNCAPINADATQIHQLIMNLSTNAFHSMEQLGGTLSIILKEVELPATMEHKRLNLKPGRYARLDVQDTGTGIEAGILSHIFDPYFTTKPRGKGTGLGLAVVYGIVENHGGKIICSSQPGVGTLFSVYLPVVESTDTRNAEIQAPLPKGTENILFIDDEETLALLGERTLASLGYTIFPMTESLQALEAFREDPSRYDLVITDQTMPRLTGSELAKEMLKIRPDIPIILCTGHSSIINAEKAKATGIKSFLMKPVSKKVMAEEVRKVLNEAALLKR